MLGILLALYQVITSSLRDQAEEKMPSAARPYSAIRARGMGLGVGIGVGVVHARRVRRRGWACLSALSATAWGCKLLSANLRDTNRRSPNAHTLGTWYNTRYPSTYVWALWDNLLKGMHGLIRCCNVVLLCPYDTTAVPGGTTSHGPKAERHLARLAEG